jgi:hypothetical protein
MTRANLFISNFKKYIKRIIAIVCLIAVLICMMIKYMDLTKTSETSRFYDFYHYVEDNTIDVLCIGSSHIAAGLSPVQMWDDYGISAYNLWGGTQSAWFSYYYLTEALKTQNPKVVILDVYTVISDEEYLNEQIGINLMTLNINYNKYCAIKAAGADNLTDLLLTFPIMHTRYNELDIGSWDNTDTCFLGLMYRTGIEPYENVENVESVVDVTPISDMAEEYIRKSIELCQQNDISIILSNAPWPCVTAENQQKYNYVNAIAEEYGIPFINGCLMTDELQMDYTQDSFGDAGHLNYYGVTKYTTWMENFLSDNYDLEDHRGDSKYSHWEQASVRLQKKKNLEALAACQDDVEFIEELLQNSDTYCVMLYNGDEESLSSEWKTILNEYGIDLEASGAVVYESGEVVYQNTSEEEFEYHEYQNKRIFEVKKEGNQLSLVIDGSTICTSTLYSDPGVSIYYYSTVFGMGTWNLRTIAL